jgi:transposase-like protein
MLKEDRYRELIEEQRTSGLTIKEFCSNHGIARATFHYWKKKLSRPQLRNEFIPLIIKPSEETLPRGSVSTEMNTVKAALLELVFPNGTILRVQHDLDLAHLRALIHLYD